MNVMILAAGEGSRLRPLTERIAKPAVPVLGRPIAVQLLRWLSEAGIDRVVLNLHHHADDLQRLIETSGPGLPEVRFSHEPVLLGTGGALRHARPLLDADGPLLVINSDVLCDVDLNALVAAHRRSGAAVTLAVAQPHDGYGVVDVDERGRVRALSGAPRIPEDVETRPRLFTGCHVLDPTLVDAFPDGEVRCIRELYRRLAVDGAVRAWNHEGFWWEFGTPARYLAASLELLRTGAARGTRLTEHDPIVQVGTTPVARGAGARIASDARLEGAIAVGFASEIRPGAELSDSIVLPEAWVGPGARLRRAIVAGGTEVPAGFVAEDTLIAPPAPEDGENAGLRLLPLAGATV